MDALQRHPELFNGPVFTWLANISDEASLSKEERIRYDAALRAYRDTIAVMDGQYSEGMEKGREEGRAEEALNIARNLKNMNLPIADIIKATNLSAEVIERL